MKVKDISNRTGIPSSTIRYYDRAGITGTSRKDNSYRDYGDKDALDLLHAQLLRSYGLSMDETKDAMDDPLEDIVQKVQMRKHLLEIELQRSMQRLRRIEEVSLFIQGVLKNDKKVFEFDRGESYNIYSFPNRDSLSKAEQKALLSLGGSFPFAYAAYQIPKEELESGKEILHCQYGLGMLVKNMPYAEIEMPEEIKPLPASRILSGYFETEDPVCLERKRISPLLAEMEKRGIPLQDLKGRFYLGYKHEGKTYYGISVGAELPR